jgi:hypothetical protein
MARRQLASFSVSAVGENNLMTASPDLFTFRDGGKSLLFLLLNNIGSADADLILPGEPTSAAVIPFSGGPVEFGPYQFPGQVPLVRNPSTADVVVTPFLEGV